MKRNPGHLPSEAVGKRVRVQLRRGTMGTEDPNPMSPPGWAADGKSGCKWALTGSPFDIVEFEVIA
ncbi:conserved hypothetical protein [Sphingomonas sp. AX6]|nr:conserved hypothetical protein [Sphingomonas sp. AX6]